MSREGICGRCHEATWLDRCRHCASWFCDLCFALAGTVSGVKHAKLTDGDVAVLDTLKDHERKYKVFK